MDEPKNPKVGQNQGIDQKIVEMLERESKKFMSSLYQECYRESVKDEWLGIALGGLGLVSSAVATWALSPYFFGSVAWCSAFLFALHGKCLAKADAMMMFNTMHLLRELTIPLLEGARDEAQMGKV